MKDNFRSGFAFGIGCALVGLAIAWLLGWVVRDDCAQKDRLRKMHEAELSACIKEHGKCHIEYLKDRTDTIYAAKVVADD